MSNKKRMALSFVIWCLISWGGVLIGNLESLAGWSWQVGYVTAIVACMVQDLYMAVTR